MALCLLSCTGQLLNINYIFCVLSLGINTQEANNVLSQLTDFTNRSQINSCPIAWCKGIQCSDKKVSLGLTWRNYLETPCTLHLSSIMEESQDVNLEN